VLGQAKLDSLFRGYISGLCSADSVSVREFSGKGHGVSCTNTLGFSTGQLIFAEPVLAAGSYRRGASGTPLCAHCLCCIRNDLPSAVRCAYRRCSVQWCSRDCKDLHTSHLHLCIGHCFEGESAAEAAARHSGLSSLQELGGDCWMTTQVLAQLVSTGDTQRCWEDEYGVLETIKWSDLNKGEDSRRTAMMNAYCQV
jgi:hypothetical protein